MTLGRIDKTKKFLLARRILSKIGVVVHRLVAVSNHTKRALHVIVER